MGVARSVTLSNLNLTRAYRGMAGLYNPQSFLRWVSFIALNTGKIPLSIF
jgi:hypothetical protein